jgi:ATP-dependent Lon protease
MARDSQTKLSKKDQMKKRSNKQDEMNKKKKRAGKDDSDNIVGSDSESDEMDMHEFRKYIKQIFPSTNLDKKIQAGERLKKVLDKTLENESDEEDVKPARKSSNKKKVVESDTEEEEAKPQKKSNKKQNKKKVVESDTEEEEEWESVSDEDDDDSDYESEEDEDDSAEYDLSDDDESSEEDDSSEEEPVVKKSRKNKKSKKVVESEEETEDEEVTDKKGSSKYNIIFTIGANSEEDKWESESDYDSDYDDYEDPDEVTEDEDESVSSDSSDEDEGRKKKNKKSPRKKIATKKENKKEQSETDENETIVDTKKPLDKTDSNDVLEKLRIILAQNPNDKSIKKLIGIYEEDIEKSNIKRQKKEKKHKAKNMRIFRKIVRDKNTMNDFAFYEKLDIEEQKKMIKELKEINKITRIKKPYRMTLLESDIPVQFKAAAMKKINSLRYMEPGSGEFYKIKNWVDTFMRIPFGKTEGLPISIDDGVDKCHAFMETAQATLDNAVYGLNDAKIQIMQMLGQLLTNPKAIGTAIAIHGPPGTGKTSLVKEGISKILNRPFAFIALGGATDSSFLEGHGYTYEGSTWGKIVQILIDSKCMNPVIYFDELDKISDTPRGEEIAGILTHLTDTSQNSQFHDKYFAEINFDLSKCLFIFSYNDESKINPILKDRMYRIKTKGYGQKEKTSISNNYLLPKIREQVRFNDGEIIIPDVTLGYIIETHCNKEDGVRNLKRCLEIIYTKLNLYRLMKPGSNLFEKDMALKVEFPFTVTKDIVDKLIKREDDSLATWRNLYL